MIHSFIYTYSFRSQHIASKTTTTTTTYNRMSLIKDSTISNNNNNNSRDIIDDNNMFSISFANNHPMDMVNNPPELLSSNNSFHDDFVMDLDTTETKYENIPNMITTTTNSPKQSNINFITGGFEFDDNSNVQENKNDNTSGTTLLSSKGSYENIIDSYANVAQQNYRLWLSSF